MEIQRVMESVEKSRQALELLENLHRKSVEENEKLKQEIDILKERIENISVCNCNNYAKKLGVVK